jgi:hypothetical protein
MAELKQWKTQKILNWRIYLKIIFYLDESEKLINEIIVDEDAPKDDVMKKSLKTNYKNKFDNKNIKTNIEIKSI